MILLLGLMAALSPFLNIPAPASATDLYVAATGSDSFGTGDVGNPWASVQQAVTQIVSRRLNIGMTANLTIHVSGDLFNTNVVITDAANPTNGHTITILAPINTTRLIGGQKVNTNNCVIYSGSIQRCPVSGSFYTLFENGVRGAVARTPNLVVNGSYPVALEPHYTGVDGSYTTLQYNPAELTATSWNNPDVSVFAWAGPGWRWFTGTTPITSIDTTGHVITLSQITKYSSATGGTAYIMQGDLSMLDQAGEWYLDRTDFHGSPGGGQHYLYYWPRNTPITSQEIMYPTTQDTFSMIGRDESHVVTGWIVNGVEIDVSDYIAWYRYGTWGTFAAGDFDPTICTGHASQDCQWAYEAAIPQAQHGLIHLRNVESVTFQNVHVKDSGLSALYAQLHVQHVTVQDSKFEHCGYDCLQFEGGFNGEGDKNNNNTISDVMAVNIGETVAHGAGVRFANSGHNTLVHMDISQAIRDGIYVTDVSTAPFADGYAIGNSMSLTHLYNLGQDSGDMGALGFWALGSPSGGPYQSNTANQFLIENINAHPSMTDAGPNGVFTDDGTYGQVLSNINVTATVQGTLEREHNSGEHTLTNCSFIAGGSPNGSFNSFLMDPTIGLTGAYPY